MPVRRVLMCNREWCIRSCHADLAALGFRQRKLQSASQQLDDVLPRFCEKSLAASKDAAFKNESNRNRKGATASYALAAVNSLAVHSSLNLAFNRRLGCGKESDGIPIPSSAIDAGSSLLSI